MPPSGAPQARRPPTRRRLRFAPICNLIKLFARSGLRNSPFLAGRSFRRAPEFLASASPQGAQGVQILRHFSRESPVFLRISAALRGPYFRQGDVPETGGVCRRPMDRVAPRRRAVGAPPPWVPSLRSGAQGAFELRCLPRAGPDFPEPASRRHRAASTWHRAASTWHGASSAF